MYEPIKLNVRSDTMKLALIAADPAAVREKIDAPDISVFDLAEGEYAALRCACDSGADYVLKVNDAGVSAAQLEQAAVLAGEKDVVIGRGTHNGFSGFMMRLVYTYSFRVFMKCGAPSFLMIDRKKLGEYLENCAPDFCYPDAAVIASAYYDHAAIGTVDCTDAGGYVGAVAKRVFGHVFHSLKTFKQLDLRLQKRYGEYQQEETDKREMGVVDKVLALAHREMITYLIFGVLTTVVNYVVYWLCTLILTPDIFLKDKNYLVSNVICWIAAVVFAYVTNKLFVFESRSWKLSVVGREVVSFVGARLVSLAFDMGFMFVFVSLIGMNEFIAKLIVQIVVVILNYIFSKLFIFRKKK